MQISGVILHSFRAVLNEEDSDKFEENLIKDLMLKGDLSIHSTFTRTVLIRWRVVTLHVLKFVSSNAISDISYK